MCFFERHELYYSMDANFFIKPSNDSILMSSHSYSNLDDNIFDGFIDSSTKKILVDL